MKNRLLFLIWFFSCSVWSSGFVVENIQLEGNKKIATSTVLSYITLKEGEFLDDKNSVSIIKDLYKTGFFNAIEIQRVANNAVFVVEERPSIKEINTEGNVLIEDDAMKEALEGFGIKKGQLFNRSVLDKIEQQLKGLYYSMGKYSVTIKTSVDNVSEGLVVIDIDISEGLPAKVRDINITGNNVFSDEDLLEDFSTTIPSQSFFGSADDFSQAKIDSDLIEMRSKYLNNGYLDFRVDSSQVTISPNKKDINVAVNIHEGNSYTINSIALTGDFVISKDDLLMLIPFNIGETFSRIKVTTAVRSLTKRLGAEGYAFANVNVIPEVNAAENKVGLTFVVDPGKKMNVRYIQFEGNEKTSDLVLRREMRQFESAPFSVVKVDRSKVRLQRLNYVSSVKVRYKRVRNEPDQMDIIVSITERFSGNLSLGIGYSEAQGALLNFGISHDNVFGTGKKIGIDVNTSASQKKYTLSYTNPYYTKEGVSRGFFVSFSETDASGLDISNYLLDQTKVGVNYGFPLSEFNTLKLNAGIQRDEISLSSSTTSDEVYEFIIANDNQYNALTDTSTITEAEYQMLFVSSSFSYDSRNRSVFADSGQLHNVSLELFSGDLDFYKFGYRNQFVFPFIGDSSFSFKSIFGVGDGIKGTSDLPFYERYYAGGARTVHGYVANSLGPDDSRGSPFGGKYKVVFNSEVLLKLRELGDPKTFRIGLFYDAGNVFSNSSDIEFENLSTSYGIAAKWFSPVGPIEFSYGWPINASSTDDTKHFQFSLGAAF